MFAGFCFNNIFCAATNFGCIDSFFAQFQKRRRNDGWWFPLVLLLPVCLNSKRLLSTSCNKQGQRNVRIYLHCDGIGTFEVRRIVCVEKVKQTLNNELKFHIVNIYSYLLSDCDESSLYSRINYVHSPDGELLCGCPGIVQQFFRVYAYTYCIMPTPRCWHGRNRTLWFSVERFV